MAPHKVAGALHWQSRNFHVDGAVDDAEDDGAEDNGAQADAEEDKEDERQGGCGCVWSRLRTRAFDSHEEDDAEDDDGGRTTTQWRNNTEGAAEDAATADQKTKIARSKGVEGRNHSPMSNARQGIKTICKEVPVYFRTGLARAVLLSWTDQIDAVDRQIEVVERVAS